MAGSTETAVQAGSAELAKKQPSSHVRGERAKAVDIAAKKIPLYSIERSESMRGAYAKYGIGGQEGLSCARRRKRFLGVEIGGGDRFRWGSERTLGLGPGCPVSRLFAALQARGADLAVARTGDRSHPVFCLCRRTVLPHLTAFLADGGRKVQVWLATRTTVEVPFDDEAEAFANLNTPEQLARLAG